MSLTQELLKELLHYDPETGVFTRKTRSAHSVQIGDVAGCVMSNGYREISLCGSRYLEHRLVWMWVHGRWPSFQVDHINGLRDDNRLCNLREATQSQNNQNQKRARSNNATGYLGVSWDSVNGKFESNIKVEGRKVRLGRFIDPAKAHAAYVAAKRRLHEYGTL